MAFAEIRRVLQPGGLLLLAFHTGGDVISPEEMWGTKVQIEFYHFERAAIERRLEEAGFRIEEVVERGPYEPEVEYQSRRAFILVNEEPTPISVLGPASGALSQRVSR